MPAPRRHIQAVVFDLDDTLYRERDYVRSGFSAVGEYIRRRRASRADFEGWMWRRFLAGQRERMFDALNARFHLACARRDIRRLVRIYRLHRPRIRPCRGVEPLLGELRRRRLKLGLLSDGYLPAQRLKLNALALEKYFDAIVLTQQMGRAAWKPSPAGFEKMRRLLALPHSACVHVADNPEKDFLAANRLGWLTIQWRRSGQLHADKPPPEGGRPRKIIRTGPQLLRILRQQGRAAFAATRHSPGKRGGTFRFT